VDQRPEFPFRLTHGWSDAQTYLLQRRVFGHLTDSTAVDVLAIEESIMTLLERVVQCAYRRPTFCLGKIGSKQRETVRQIEFILSTRLDEPMTLGGIAGEVGMSRYHLCRMFHRATGNTLHDYRKKIRLRWSLEDVMGSEKPLVDVALDAGFSSHSHFTETFRREFSQTPSKVRAQH
jgi:transcriptional regulator GlxA family with amidase domain